jgi:HSP20 family protein
MALFSPFWPMARPSESLWDDLDDHPFINLSSSFFRDANITRPNRANVSETDTEYRVELEVPGYKKNEINIEFGSDGKSLTIAGKSETSREEGSRPQGVTVEEVPEEGEKSQPREQKESTEVAQTSQERQVAQPAGPRYWISERSSGSFSRTFSFRTALDHDKASASLEHGVLSVVIPKATKSAARKISIA